MDNTLTKIESEEFIILREETYNVYERKKYIDYFEKLVKGGKIQGQYEDKIWMCYSGIRYFGINFDFSNMEYKRHFGKELDISKNMVVDMIKSYVLHICGDFIFSTIAQKVNGIKDVLTRYGEYDLECSITQAVGIFDFLGFIGLPENQIEKIEKQIRIQPSSKFKPRELAHLVNYMVVDNEIKDMYSSDIRKEDFLKWFPIFFWTQITFVLPLRVTEMLVTPYDCISRKKDGTVYLRVRRTMLKKGKRHVYYEVDKDYKIFEYPFPDNGTIKVIEKYQRMTIHHERKYLFDFSELCVNGMVSRASFNGILEDFISEKIIGNLKYDYVKYASGIKEFQTILAGDSRPIAMSNLYYQDAGADICRQLADHVHITTSEGYYSNVSNTVQAASIMQYQRRINHKYDDIEYLENVHAVEMFSNCASIYQPKNTGNILDCIKENHIEECIGCRYYTPSQSELSEEVKIRKEKLDIASKAVIECMADVKGKNEKDFEKIFLDAHTEIIRYKTVCDIKSAEEVKKWRRHGFTTMTS